MSAFHAFADSMCIKSIDRDVRRAEVRTIWIRGRREQRLKRFERGTKVAGRALAGPAPRSRRDYPEGRKCSPKGPRRTACRPR